MILSNGYAPDPRVQREAHGLVEQGFRVIVLCWDRRSERASQENDNGVEIIRIHSVKSSYGRGWRQMLHMTRFWREVTQRAKKIRPAAVHCHDLDTLYPGYRIKRMIGARLVYDAHEHYPAMMSLYLPKLFVAALTRWERWLHSKVDATITASSILRDEFNEAGITPVITLGNYPYLDDFLDVDPVAVARERESLANDDTTLVVGYIGGFTRNRLFEPFLEAATLQSGVQFHLWGDGYQRALIEKMAAQNDNVSYHGWLDYKRVPVVFSALDVVYYGLRRDYPGAIYNAPNTLAQAMAAGRPIIGTEVGDLGRIMTESRCGLLLSSESPDDIANAIERLKSRALRKQLGLNGRTAAEIQYNAGVVKAGLVSLYESLDVASIPQV